MATKKIISISVKIEADRKLKEVSKLLGYSKSEIVEYLILSKLPNTENVEEVKKFANEIAEWLIEQKLKEKDKTLRGKSKIIIPNSS
jgi:hypothetical protein